jgi:hypothetical protein
MEFVGEPFHHINYVPYFDYISPDSLLSRTPPSGMGGATAEAARDETNDWTEGQEEVGDFIRSF